MPFKLKTLGVATIASAGTAIQLSSLSTKVFYSVVVQADSANIGSIYVGDSTVTASNGIEVAPGFSCEIDGETMGRAFDQFDLVGIYFNSNTMGNKARLVGFERI